MATLATGCLVGIAGVIPLWARLSDRIGRKPVFITGNLGRDATPEPPAAIEHRSRMVDRAS